MPGPLTGVRVIDLTAVLLGPFATQHLADMGADVIKVEPPEGDLLRASGGSLGRDKSMGPIYMAANRNKRSICLDLKKPAACAVLKDMIKGADLFIHNSRPQAIERLGLGYADLKKINPSIIYAYSLGYARRGPYGHKPAFDDLVQGVSGAASLQSRVDGLPPRFMPSLIADKTTGLHLCIAVLGALYHRKCTGEGQMIEVPMLETLASFWLTEHLFGATWRPERGTMGYDRIINKFRHPFPTKDGYMVLSVGNDATFKRFCEGFGLEALLADARYATNPARVANRQLVTDTLTPVMQRETTDWWMEKLEGLKIGCGPINTLKQVFDDPHVIARGMEVQMKHSSGEMVTVIANPVRLSETPVDYRFAPPLLGEHTSEVLQDLLGMDNATFASLKKKGVI